MHQKLRLRNGLLTRLREIHRLPSEESQARLMGVSRSTVRRMESGEQPSADFIVALCTTYQLGIGEAFEIVPSNSESIAA
jgi:transcriptional regulator with XRE-family HTH domain